MFVAKINTRSNIYSIVFVVRFSITEPISAHKHPQTTLCNCSGHLGSFSSSPTHLFGSILCLDLTTCSKISGLIYLQTMSVRGKPKTLSILVYRRNSLARRTAVDRFVSIDCKSGNIDISKAHYFFNEMLYMSPPPPLSWFTSLLGGLVRSQHFSVAISFYKRLNVSGFPGSRPNLIILNVLLNSYSSMTIGSAGYSAFGLILKYGYRPSTRTFGSLVKGLCLEEKMVDAVGLLSKMLRLGCTPNVVTYNTILNGLCKTGNVTTALELHRLMVSGKVVAATEGCRPNTLSYTLINGATIEWPLVDAQGKWVRFSPNVVSYNCLVDGLCRSGMEEDAGSLLNEMIVHEIFPNTVTYTTVIDLLCKKGKVEEAMGVLEKMISRGRFPDTVTYSTIVDGYCKIGKIENALRLYKDMNSRGIFGNNVTITALLKGLFLMRKAGDAMSLFRYMKKMDGDGACSPNKVTYATMIDGLCKERNVDKAEELFLEMQDSGICPDSHVYSSLIDGLCKQGNTGKAQKLFLEVLATGVSLDEAVYSALIDGLCKEGDMLKAKELFLQMQISGIPPNVISYNSIIDGLYRSGNVEEANTLLEKMIRDGILPNAVTFKIIINNLGKKGSREQAARNVISTMESCGYECGVASYNALIHCYCKAGRLEDAYNLLAVMEAKGCSPDVRTYEILMRGFAHDKESARVKELTQKMHNIRISPSSNRASALLERINKMDD